MKRRAAAFALIASAVLAFAAHCRGRERAAAPAATPKPAAAVESGAEFRSFEIPSAVARPRGIAVGPDGALWFTESQTNRVARISTQPPHAIEEFPLPHDRSEPWAIASGRDGNVYFTEVAGNRIGWIAAGPPHGILEIPVPSSGALPRAIAAGADGNVWFPDLVHIARLAPGAAAVEEFALPRRQTASAIAAGPDGNVWWGGSGGTIVRVLPIFPAAMLELPLRARNSAPTALAAGSDGNLWFLQLQTGTLGRVLLQEPHTITELRLPGPSAAVEGLGLCATPGAIWVTQRGQKTILRVEALPPHRVREIPVPREIGEIEYLAAGPDGNVWFTSSWSNRVGMLVVAQPGGSGPAPRDWGGKAAPSADEYRPSAPPQVTGEIDVRSDRDCTVFVDGVETVRMRRDDGQVLRVPAGTHRIVGVTAGGDARAEKTVEVFDSLRAVAILEDFRAPEMVGGPGAAPVSGAPSSSPLAPPPGGADPHVEFVAVPAGDFVMGSDAGNNDGRPAHRVRVSRPFEMAKYELTQKEWQTVMGPLQPDTSRPEWSVPRPRIRYMDVGESKPVIGASWEDAMELVAALNRIAPGRNYRLPTEAEWEYACRAGSAEDLPADPGAFAWIKDNFGLEMHPVGKKRPNAWGLYDMHGNASEWVSDWYDPDFYRRSPATDPTGPASGSARTHRGGDAWNPASNSACSRRSPGQTPSGREGPVGIRLVRDAR